MSISGVNGALGMPGLMMRGQEAVLIDGGAVIDRNGKVLCRIGRRDLSCV